MIVIYIIAGCLVTIFLHDVFNKKHSILHNFPVIGHIRFLLEKAGPELRQYIVASNREELPFPRRHRTWIYASSKKQNNFYGFGSDMDFSKKGHIIIKHKTFLPPSYASNPQIEANIHEIKCAKIMGDKRRKKPYRPGSVVNISAMSFGALSARAVESLNKGAKIAGCYQNTGEGGFAEHHNHGADVIFQVGTGYFGVRDSHSKFSMEKLTELINKHPAIKAIEIKLSQGAKPGHGGILPAAKVSKEIAAIRGLNPGEDAISPPFHSTFHDVPSMIDFIENVAEATGLPVGIKSAIGDTSSFDELFTIMAATGKGPDFITIDGGEGGTGAAPPSFTDNVSLPLEDAFIAIQKVFDRYRDKLDNRIVFIASGKLGLPATALKAFAMGADMINIAREPLMSIGCIQAQSCHTNRCPSGVATQNKWLQAGIDPALKSVRCANYIKTLRKEILEISRACGYAHPAEFQPKDIAVFNGSKYIGLEEIRYN